MVSDSNAFCEEVLIKNKPIRNFKDKNNKHLTDKYMCEALGVFLDLPVYDLYKKVCGFVHFSSSSFYNITKAKEKMNISMLIGRNNREDGKDTYKRLTIELANQFLLFGEILIKVLFASWLKQKKEFADESGSDEKQL